MAFCEVLARSLIETPSRVTGRAFFRVVGVGILDHRVEPVQPGDQGLPDDRPEFTRQIRGSGSRSPPTTC